MARWRLEFRGLVMGEAGGSAERRAEELRARGLKSAGAWAAGAVGERRVAEALADLPPEWLVLHDRLLFPGRSESNLDHVLVGPAGVVLIDAKNWSGNLSEWEGGLFKHQFASERSAPPRAGASRGGQRDADGHRDGPSDSGPRHGRRRSGWGAGRRLRRGSPRPERLGGSRQATRRLARHASSHRTRRGAAPRRVGAHRVPVDDDRLEAAGRDRPGPRSSRPVSPTPSKTRGASGGPVPARSSRAHHVPGSDRSGDGREGGFARSPSSSESAC